MDELFCHDGSEIYKSSGDRKLAKLCDHLVEYKTKKYEKWSKVKRDLKLWELIYGKVCNMIESEFNIKDIDVFIEIVSIRKIRNDASHSKEIVSIDELKKVTKYPDDIMRCIEMIH